MIFTDRIRSMGEGNAFIGVCHSVQRGVSLLGGVCLLKEICIENPPGDTVRRGSVGAHPTGMQSCFSQFFKHRRNLVSASFLFQNMNMSFYVTNKSCFLHVYTLRGKTRSDSFHKRKEISLNMRS